MRLAVLLLALILAGGAANAQTLRTGYDIPRFVSLNADEAYARRGPGQQFRIDWVFTRNGMPLRVVDEYYNWRRVEDAEGEGGWVHRALLHGRRTVLLKEDAPLLDRPNERGRAVAQAEAGVIAVLDGCEGDWCSVSVDRHRGWTPAASLWGVPE